VWRADARYDDTDALGWYASSEAAEEAGSLLGVSYIPRFVMD